MITWPGLSPDQKLRTSSYLSATSCGVHRLLDRCYLSYKLAGRTCTPDPITWGPVGAHVGFMDIHGRCKLDALHPQRITSGLCSLC